MAVVPWQGIHQPQHPPQAVSQRPPKHRCWVLGCPRWVRVAGGCQCHFPLRAMGCNGEHQAPVPAPDAGTLAISQPAHEARPPPPRLGDSHHRAGTVPVEPQQAVGKPSNMKPPGWILPLLLPALLAVGHATPCSPQPSASRFVCTEPTLSTFPRGLPSTTVAISVEFTALATLPPDALAGLPRLQELHLSSNLLTTLPEPLLRPVPTLRVLDLTDNLLADLPAGIFTSAHHLQHLALRGNQLQVLKPTWFQHLPQLQWLDLAANALAELPPEVFRPLRSLQNLDLSHNRMATLAPGALAGLRALEKLDLEGNQLGTLLPSTFMPVPGLRLLFLQGNELQALPAGIFVPLRHLRILDLAQNRLQALELPPRPPGPPLDLDISGNPWDCGCQLLEVLQRAAPRLVTARDTLCASPPRHRGREVAEVSQAGDRGCGTKGGSQSPPGP
ncbi:leucine-rich alpha-2-glycoprotein [Melanerpes formicivorus]|uniref:leucine-rich alpha-2-glycoprotein n=1 Tax=Melanerpes formicivorus TaxID=211600 RepID=UPI00358E13B6